MILSVLLCVAISAIRSNGRTRVTITALDVEAEPQDHKIPLIKRWFGAIQILKLLNAPSSWSEMHLAVEATGGLHEVIPDVQSYVEHLLGERMLNSA